MRRIIAKTDIYSVFAIDRSDVYLEVFGLSSETTYPIKFKNPKDYENFVDELTRDTGIREGGDKVRTDMYRNLVIAELFKKTEVEWDEGEFRKKIEAELEKAEREETGA